MLRLFAFDLDQTLLVEGSIKGRNRNCLRALQNAGKTIALVTGRVLRSPQFLAEQAGLRAYCIGSNGAVVATPDGKVLYKEAIPTQTAVQLIQIGIRHRVYFHFYSQETLFSPYCLPERFAHLIASKTEYGTRMQCNIHIQERADLEMGSQEMLKIQYSTGEDVERQNALLRDLREIPSITVTMSGKGLIEVMAERVDKWNGILVIADALGIAPEDICAMGDYSNDRRMIAKAGMGIAMGNALAEVKDAADRVTATASDFGVAQAIEQLKEEGFWS